MILLNLKVYPETFGNGAMRLAEVAADVSRKSGVRIVVAASALDAVRLMASGAEIWLQHYDTNKSGRFTGEVSSLQAEALGIRASLLNHSEHKLAKGKVLELLAGKPEGFEVIVGCRSLGQGAEWIAKSRADWILYEPPELISSKDKSVASEKPEAIRKMSEMVPGKRLIVGAGIKSREDVEISLRMGAAGIGLSSAYVLGENQKEVLEDLAAGFRATI